MASFTWERHSERGKGATSARELLGGGMVEEKYMVTAACMLFRMRGRGVARCYRSVPSGAIAAAAPIPNLLQLKLLATTVEYEYYDVLER